MKNYPHAQNGAVLIVALIMLLLLTVIGLSSMRGASLQESMASNFRESNLSFQAAEAALRKGEEAVYQEFLSNPVSICDPDDESGTYAGYSGVAKDPEYKLVLLGCLEINTGIHEYLPEGGLFRVEAEGFGATIRPNGSPAATTKLRSTFLVEE